MIGLTESFKKGAKTTVFKSLQDKINQTLWKKFCMVVPSTSAAESYEWLGQMPGVKEFLDRRQIEGLKKFKYEVANRTWEDTLGFDVDQLADNPGIVKARIPTLAQAAAEHPEELFIDVLLANPTCFDGKAFFASDHPDQNEGAFSNLVTGAGALAANIRTDYYKIKKALLNFKKRNGRALFKSVGKLTILHGPDTAQAMEEVFLTDKLSSGAINPLYKKVELVETGDIDGNDWYVTKMDAPMLPFIFQEREGWKFEWDETQKFMTKTVFYGGKARYNIAPGLPQLAFKVENS